MYLELSACFRRNEIYLCQKKLCQKRSSFFQIIRMVPGTFDILPRTVFSLSKMNIVPVRYLKGLKIKTATFLPKKAKLVHYVVTCL